MIFFILLFIPALNTITAQTLEIEDLSDNNGYIPIKLRDVEIIDNYAKIIHVINITQYLETAKILEENIHKLTKTYTNVTPLLKSISKGMDLCKTKIQNLIPRFRQKRGLINAIGKGLKYVAGTMDNDDEEKILNKIQTLEKSNGRTIIELDELTYLSTSISVKIKNITDHINNEQKTVQTYINNFKTKLVNSIIDLEDETTFLENIFQINNDLNLLIDHVNEIGHVIFNTKLGVIPSDILTTEEFNYINKTESYLHAKVALTYRENLVILTLNIPRFLDETFAEVLFESLPDKQNKTLILNGNTVLIHKNDVYKPNTLEYKKLERVNDHCVTNIVRNLEPNCSLSRTKNQEEKEIYPGLLVFKNYKERIVTNCKTPHEFENLKTYLIKFENCIIKTKLRTYENYKINIKDMFIIEKFILKITENNISLSDINIKELHFNETVKLVNHKIFKNSLINTGSNIGIFAIIVSIIIIIYIRTNRQTYIISSEPHSNDGGVIVTPNKIII